MAHSGWIIDDGCWHRWDVFKRIGCKMKPRPDPKWLTGIKTRTTRYLGRDGRMREVVLSGDFARLLRELDRRLRA